MFPHHRMTFSSVDFYWMQNNLINFCLKVFRHIYFNDRKCQWLVSIWATVHLFSSRYWRHHHCPKWNHSEVFKLQDLFLGVNFAVPSVWQVFSLLDIQAHSMLSQPVLPSLCLILEHITDVIGKYHTIFILVLSWYISTLIMSNFNISILISKIFLYISYLYYMAAKSRLRDLPRIGQARESYQSVGRLINIKKRPYLAVNVLK